MRLLDCLFVLAWMMTPRRHRRHGNREGKAERGDRGKNPRGLSCFCVGCIREIFARARETLFDA